MDNFLNDAENAHDSMIMKFVDIIIKQCNMGGLVDYSGIINQYYKQDPAKIPIMYGILNHIRVGYPVALDTVMSFCVRMRNMDFVHTIFDTFYSIWSNAETENRPICSSGYMNNIVVLLPSAFPNTFKESSVTPVPLIVEEIDGIIELAFNEPMCVDEFRTRIMYYAEKYNDIPMIVKKCKELVNYYINAYAVEGQFW